MFKKPYEVNMKIPYEVNGIPIAYKYEDIKIAIIRGQEPNFKRLKPGMAITLVQEPKNKYDKNAVALYANFMRIGYLFRGGLQDMANDFINNKEPIVSRIQWISYGDKEIKIFLGFYRGEVKQSAPASLINATESTSDNTPNLSSSTNDMQGHISPFSKDNILVHIILFFLTVGIGNVIYVLHVRRKQKERDTLNR